MLRKRSAIVLAIVTFVLAPSSFAAVRFTDISGREAIINRGPIRSHTARKATADALRPVVNATINVMAGADIDATNNDYRRIVNAIASAANNDTIILNGTFDFTQMFSAAAWALGNDGTAGTADDYSVYIPQDLNGITFTATTFGDATIQGPGDLAAVNLEGFLVFDGGDNQNWTISNLRILDFDLGIGFFDGTGGADAFNNTIIQNNLIRIPNDLNAAVAPADVNQNIGIHFSWGMNQSIVNNAIDIPGDGLGAGVSTSASIFMQSNAGGGDTYDGLTISGNQIHILNAQAADPAFILGIWDNGHAHLSDITIAGNQFINDAAGNNSAANRQRAFRVTSHSSPTTTVAYSSNGIGGANIGFEWLSGQDFSPNQPVRLATNTINMSATGVRVQSNGKANIDRNVITGSGAGGGIHVITGSLSAAGAVTEGVSRSFVTGGTGDGIVIEAGAGPFADPIALNNLSGNSGFGLRNLAAGSITAERNWWGSNLLAAVAAEVNGAVDVDPWLASGTDISAAIGFQPFIYATTSGTTTTLAGTAGADTGSVVAGDPVTMMMNGDSGTTALGELLNLDIQLGASDDVFTLGATGVPTDFDGGAGVDTLNGPSVAATWNITGAGSGSSAGIVDSFTTLETLRGGTANDSFIFGAAGSLAGMLDGNLGSDTLNNTAIPGAMINPTGPGTLDGFQGTATGVGTTFDNISLLVGSPTDISVTKTGPANVAAGSAISYTITVTNSGPDNALIAAINDVLPAGTTFVSLTSPGGWSCTTPAVGANGTVDCNHASMPAGVNVFTLVVNAPNSGGLVTNTATVSASNDSAPGNNSSSAMTTVEAFADVSITKTAPGSVSPGGTITYTITVTNGGPQSATSVVVTDTLPAGVTFVSATPSQGSCMGGTPTLTCMLGTIANSANATIQLVVQTTVGSVTVNNTATVTASETDSNPANNTSTAGTAVAAVVPTMSEWMLLALMLALAAIAVRFQD